MLNICQCEHTYAFKITNVNAEEHKLTHSQNKGMCFLLCVGLNEVKKPLSRTVLLGSFFLATCLTLNMRRCLLCKRCHNFWI